jgi:propanol-preferring alcohol dehydrogenase
MRALQIVEPGVARIEHLEVPEPGPGEVLLRVAGAGICHSDLHLLHAKQLPELPLTLGHEVAGAVEQLGSGVTGLSEGDPALVYLIWSCGACRACASGYDNYCERVDRMAYGAVPGLPGRGSEQQLAGGMAEYQVVPARALFALDDLDPVTAAPLADAGLTAYHAVAPLRARLTPSSTILLIGVGGLGHAALQILRALGAGRIVAVDVSDDKLALARRLGADLAIASSDQTRDEVIAETHGTGADVVLDFVGIPATVELARRSVARGGHIALVGAAGGALELRSGAVPIGVTTSLPFAGGRRDLLEVLALARSGRLTLEIERHPLDDATSVFQRLEAGDVMGRAVLVP